MYAIFTYIYHKNQLNVGKYTIHGSSGNRTYQHSHHLPSTEPAAASLLKARTISKTQGDLPSIVHHLGSTKTSGGCSPCSTNQPWEGSILHFIGCPTGVFWCWEVLHFVYIYMYKWTTKQNTKRTSFWFFLFKPNSTTLKKKKLAHVGWQGFFGGLKGGERWADTLYGFESQTTGPQTISWLYHPLPHRATSQKKNSLSFDSVHGWHRKPKNNGTWHVRKASGWRKRST